MLLTTFTVPGLYGRWSAEQIKPGCPVEIELRKKQFLNAFERPSIQATLHYQDGYSPTYSFYDDSETNIYEFESNKTEFVPTWIKASLVLEGRKLLFRPIETCYDIDKKSWWPTNCRNEKIVCKYKLEEDYELIDGGYGTDCSGPDIK